MSKKRKGPTPRKQRRWMARCENCGAIDVLHPRPTRGPNHYSPCPSCENDTAVYVAHPA